jgi:hypothetical protein
MIAIPLSHCVSSYLPLSDSAQAVQAILPDLVGELHSTQPQKPEPVSTAGAVARM